MIKYITTLDDIIGPNTDYYLYNKLNVTNSSLGDLTLNSLLPTASRDDDASVGCIESPDKPDTYVLTVVVNNTQDLKYSKVGSIIFVYDSTPIGYYNFDNIINIAQSDRYKFVITFNCVEKSVTKFTVSTELNKFNPNISTDAELSKLTEESMLVTDYGSYDTIYKQRKIRSTIPHTDSYRFNSYGGVFLFRKNLLNWATSFIEEHQIEDDIVDGRLLYGDTTSLLLWSEHTLYRYLDIFDDSLSFSSVTLDEYQILDCGGNYIIVRSPDDPDSYRVLSVSWTNGKIIDYKRVISDCKFYIDNLDGDLNVVDGENFRTEAIRTSCTRNNWVSLVGDSLTISALATYGKYLASYRSTFVLQLLDKGRVNGLLIFGAGGTGAVVGTDVNQAHPVIKDPSIDFNKLVEDDKLEFEFLSETLVRMYYMENGVVKFDNMIECSADYMNVIATTHYLQKGLSFIRVTHRPIYTSDKYIFGDHIGLAMTKSYQDGKVITKIIQI